MVLLKNNTGQDVVYPLRLAENPQLPPVYKTIKAGAVADLPIEFAKVQGFVRVEESVSTSQPELPLKSESKKPKKGLVPVGKQ